jgi:glycosyltransferase involved in cell wall biosynthesis
MVTFYAFPAVFSLKVKLVNYQITDAIPWDSGNIFFKVISRINFFFSDIIIANSNAGLETYQINAEKGNVIYNGVSMVRFNVLESRNSIKMMYSLNRKYCIVMVASFSINKDCNLFIDIAAEIEKTRDDIMFLAIGTGKFELDARERVEKLGLSNINFLGINLWLK